MYRAAIYASCIPVRIIVCIRIGGRLGCRKDFGIASHLLCPPEGGAHRALAAGRSVDASAGVATGVVVDEVSLVDRHCCRGGSKMVRGSVSTQK